MSAARQASRPPSANAGSRARGGGIAFALDFAALDDARRAASIVRDAIGMFKIGLELFVAAGPASVALGKDLGRPVFLDLKLCDIPETVERAVAAACALGVEFLTVHASGGPTMLRRAAERAEKEGTGLKIAAVTVMTSLDAGDLVALGVAPDVPGHVLRLARLAFDQGVRAFVCSAVDVRAMRLALGPDVTLLTPGVRPASEVGADDQKRVATAAQAAADGADWLVVGRPIRDAADPLAAARALAKEAADARASSQRSP